MTMRQWRVGSFSLGLTLVLIGVAIVSAWFGGREVYVDFVMRWWPVALILLGLEIVIASFLYGRERPRLTYDWVAFVAIFLIVGSSAGLEVLDVTGVLAEVRRAVHSAVYSVEFERRTVPIDKGIARVVLSCDEGAAEIRASTADSIVCFGNGRISAPTKEEALAWAAESGVTARNEGDTCYVALKAPPLSSGIGHEFSESTWVILVPAEMDLEFSGSSMVNVVARGLSADWDVTTDGPITVSLGATDNLKLAARTRTDGAIAGKIDWANVSAEPGGEQTVTQAGNEGWTVKEATVGLASHSLKICSPQEIYVDTLE